MAVAKKKRWYHIIAPKSFRQQEIGETPSDEPEHLIGRNIKINASVITNDPKKQNQRIIFKIKEVKSDNAFTQLEGYELILSQVKRLSRKGGEKIEDSFSAVSKDGVKLQIKPIFTTRAKVKNSVMTALRKSIQAFVLEDLKNKDCDDFIAEVMMNKIQKQLKDHTKKILPLAGFEFKKVERVY